MNFMFELRDKKCRTDLFVANFFSCWLSSFGILLMILCENLSSVQNIFFFIFPHFLIHITFFIEVGKKAN